MAHKGKRSCARAEQISHSRDWDEDDARSPKWKEGVSEVLQPRKELGARRWAGAGEHHTRRNKALERRWLVARPLHAGP